MAFNGVPGQASNGDLSQIELQQQRLATAKGEAVLLADDSQASRSKRGAAGEATGGVLGAQARSGARAAAGAGQITERGGLDGPDSLRGRQGPTASVPAPGRGVGTAPHSTLPQTPAAPGGSSGDQAPAEQGAGGGSDTGEQADSGAGSGSGDDDASDSGSGSGSDTGSGGETDPGNGGTGSDPGTDTGGGSDTGSGTGTDTGSGGGTTVGDPVEDTTNAVGEAAGGSLGEAIGDVGQVVGDLLGAG